MMADVIRQKYSFGIFCVHTYRFEGDFIFHKLPCFITLNCKNFGLDTENSWRWKSTIIEVWTRHIFHRQYNDRHNFHTLGINLWVYGDIISEDSVYDIFVQ